jgi:excisionase family DNA binding protein
MIVCTGRGRWSSLQLRGILGGFEFDAFDEFDDFDDFDDFDEFSYTGHPPVKSVMSAFVRTPPPAAAERQLPAGLHLALGSFTKDLTAKVVALVNAQLAATKPSRKTVEKAVAESVPVLVEQAFVTCFLAGEEHAREQRAFLSHVLSAAELQATVGKDWAALVQAAGASKAAANAHDDEWLTSEAASKLLHVSRTHLNTLADSDALGVVRLTHGGHRRISKAALLKYKALSQKHQAKGLDAMVAASQKLGLYDAELDGLQAKTRR